MSHGALSPAAAPRLHAARLPFLDALRALAAQVIVWHHIAWYGPLSDIALPALPWLIDGLYFYGGMVVQMFLVTSGFLTAQSLLRIERWTPRLVVRQIGHRYWRLARPYFVALALAIGANAVAGAWMEHESIAAFPTAPQLAAHVLLLQKVLGYESLSAGIWYIAVDLQLYMLCVVVTALAHGLPASFSRALRITPLQLTQAVLGVLSAGALFWWNRQPELDIWAIYFLGSYYLGMVVAWRLEGRLSDRALLLVFALGLGALGWHYRERLMVALATAALITIVGLRGGLESWPRQRWIAYAAATSYWLFMVHFPVCLLFNAGLSPAVAEAPWLAAGGMVLAYLASLLTASLCFHVFERREGQRNRPVRSAVQRSSNAAPAGARAPAPA